jgi:hypothetical protein
MARRRDPWLEDQIARYLATGDYDPCGQVGPADNMIDGMKNYGRALRGALAAELRRRSRRRRHPPVPDDTGVAFARHPDHDLHGAVAADRRAMQALARHIVQGTGPSTAPSRRRDRAKERRKRKARRRSRKRNR